MICKISFGIFSGVFLSRTIGYNLNYQRKNLFLIK